SGPRRGPRGTARGSTRRRNPWAEAVMARARTAPEASAPGRGRPANPAPGARRRAGRMARSETGAHTESLRTAPGSAGRGTAEAAAGALRSATGAGRQLPGRADGRSEEHTSELQSRFDLVCRLLLEKKKER